MTDGLVASIIDFCRTLREAALLVTPGESIDAVRAVEAVDLADRGDVYFALRTLLTTRREDLRIFDALFDEWWLAATSATAATSDSESRKRRQSIAAPGVRRTDPRQTVPSATFLSRWASPTEEPSTEAPILIDAPSAIESRARKDFAAFTSDELADVERVAARIVRHLNARPSRRWKAARRGARLDLRRTVRWSLRTGGDPLELARRDRKLRRTKLVALCDVSGSMDLYSRFLLQFLYALQHAFARVETFAFSTRLARITDALARDSYRDALDDLARDVPGWSGGTKIGESVAAFLAGWPRLLDRRTVVIVLSDGWDTGEPEILGTALQAIRRRVGRVVWLNPLLGNRSYQPLTRGMQAALPHVDVFAPAHDLASLAALARHLAL
jgi:uncharacterized protein with von Willebrand factor type A (vWA) domain